jgi:hypothetical protein
MVIRNLRLARLAALVTVILLWGGCGDSQADPPVLNVDVFGWGPTGFGTDGFVSGLPAYDLGETVRVSVTQPLDFRVLASQVQSLSDPGTEIPDVPFGDRLRLDLEIFDTLGNTIASGATPIFDFGSDLERKAYRLQVAASNSFVPVGSVVVDRDSGARKFTQTRLDYRGSSASWLGRTGHTAAVLQDGRVLIVGGADVEPGGDLASLPSFRSVYSDIQIFEPATGYFTDVAFDEKTNSLSPNGSDRLFEPRAFHTMTHIGDDRFVVVGGFADRQGTTRPVNTIEVIDLSAARGYRVQRMVNALGESQVLSKARGWHTASFRSVDNAIVIAGGVGPQGATDVLDTVELLQLNVNMVDPQVRNMTMPRARHSAATMADGQTVWIVGGHDASAVTATTELLTLDPTGVTEADGTAGELETPRFGTSAIRLSQLNGRFLLVTGGYTDFDGGVSDKFGVSYLGRGEFQSNESWKLGRARGGLHTLELPQSGDVVVFGGRDAMGTTVETAERLVFQGFTEENPFLVQSAAGTFYQARYGATATFLSSGRILVIGGEGTLEGNPAALDNAEIYNAEDPIRSVLPLPDST